MSSLLLRDNSEEMPLFLRFLTIISPAGILMIFACLVPLSSYGVSGRIVSYGEFWRSGGALIGVSGGLLLTAIGVGIFKGKKWAKQLILATIIMQNVLAFAAVGEANRDEIAGGLVSLALVNALTVWYLFFKKSVKSYFKSERDVQPRP